MPGRARRAFGPCLLNALLGWQPRDLPGGRRARLAGKFSGVHAATNAPRCCALWHCFRASTLHALRVLCKLCTPTTITVAKTGGARWQKQVQHCTTVQQQHTSKCHAPTRTSPFSACTIRQSPCLGRRCRLGTVGTLLCLVAAKLLDAVRRCCGASGPSTPTHPRRASWCRRLLLVCMCLACVCCSLSIPSRPLPACVRSQWDLILH